MLDGSDVIAVFDGSLEGLLTVVFAHYYEKLCPQSIVAQDMYQQRLGASYVYVETDNEKAMRVYKALEKYHYEEVFRSDMQRDVIRTVHYAFASPDDERYTDIYNYILLAFQKGLDVDRYQKLDYVLSVQKMAGYAGMETHKLLGFVRFAESVSGILYSEIGPVNDVLLMVANHFTERLISHPWIIHDTKRKKAAIYDTKELIVAETGGHVSIEFDACEDEFQELWTAFLKSVAIKERLNPKLQRQLMPLRYRPYMTEFRRI